MKTEKEYIIFCDESDKYGKYFANFYGGVIVGASQYERITNELNAIKTEEKLFGEIKWSKVTDQYVEKYKIVVSNFFNEIRAGNIKVRIMFTHNVNVPKSNSHINKDLEYFKLYYQFIKHAFGLQYIPKRDEGTRLRLFFDVFPDKSENAEQFKGYLLGLQQNTGFRNANIILSRDEIAEVDSHNHPLLQCLDVVLGSMSFRLNEKHKEKIPGTKKRGKRTIAKEELYKHIVREIRRMTPNFNIGVSTSCKDHLSRRWSMPYMHWIFKAKEIEKDFNFSKRKGRK